MTIEFSKKLGVSVRIPTMPEMCVHFFDIRTTPYMFPIGKKTSLAIKLVKLFPKEIDHVTQIIFLNVFL
jgi:hypothetical protein